MTTTKQIYSAGAIIIWPENSDHDQYEFEHAIVVTSYSESIGIEQNGQSIGIPLYAVKQVLAAMRKAVKEAEAK